MSAQRFVLALLLILALLAPGVAQAQPATLPPGNTVGQQTESHGGQITGNQASLSSGYGTWQCWGAQGPLPCMYDSVMAVDGTSPADVWIAGNEGTLAHWDGQTWTSLTLPTISGFRALDVLSATDGWAVARDSNGISIIVHWNGSIWHQTAHPTSAALNALAMLSPTDGWAVGAQGTILRWNGSVWSLVSSPTSQPLAAIAMVSPTDGWAVGAQGAILRWNGSVWSQVDSPTTDPLTSVVVVSASDGWAVGGGYDWGVYREYAIILHWDGNAWTQTARFDYFLLNAVDIVASDDVWAAGTSGRILHWDGNAWRYVSSSTGFPLTSISMVSATEGWVAGFRGRLVHWNGSAWTELSFPGIDAIRSISTAGQSEAWAITMSAIWRWNGATWSRHESYEGLMSVDMVSPADGWIAGGDDNGGAHAIILRWDGTAWSQVASPTNAPLYQVKMRRTDDGWIVGAAGTILRWNGVAWAQTPTPTSQSLYAVEAISASDAWAFGENVILRWNGSTWLEAAGFGVGALFYPTGATAVSADNVWAVGGYGRIIHWDGLAWNEVNSPASAYIGAIAMSGPEDGWIVGFGGAILRWNGQVWAPSASPTRVSLRSVAVGGPDNEWAVGDAGTVLRYVRATPEVIAPIEQPPAGALVSGAVTLRGFAIDLSSATGTGIDAVHIYLDGPYGTGTIIGGAVYGLDRPDVAAPYGARFGPSGWELTWDTSDVSPGVHRLYLYAHRTTDNAWSLMDPHLVIVAGGPTLWLPIVLRQQ